MIPLALTASLCTFSPGQVRTYDLVDETAGAYPMPPGTSVAGDGGFSWTVAAQLRVEVVAVDDDGLDLRLQFSDASVTSAMPETTLAQAAVLSVTTPLEVRYDRNPGMIRPSNPQAWAETFGAALRVPGVSDTDAQAATAAYAPTIATGLVTTYVVPLFSHSCRDFTVGRTEHPMLEPDTGSVVTDVTAPNGGLRVQIISESRPPMPDGQAGTVRAVGDVVLGADGWTTLSTWSVHSQLAGTRFRQSRSLKLRPPAE